MNAWQKVSISWSDLPCRARDNGHAPPADDFLITTARRVSFVTSTSSSYRRPFLTQQQKMLEAPAAKHVGPEDAT